MGLFKETLTVRTVTLLKQHPALRDDDRKFLLRIWRDELMVLTRRKPSEIGWLDFRDALSTGRLSSFHSVERTWRKVQEKHPELRGTNYGERKQKEEAARREVMSFKEPV